MGQITSFSKKQIKNNKTKEEVITEKSNTSKNSDESDKSLLEKIKDIFK